MDAAESKLVPGYRLDRYELLCPIASGGMAMVWLARLRGKRGFEKLFAIKTIKTELISDASFQEMFLDEARIASRIIHPNVAQIVELGEQDEILYLVMEFVEGDSLAKISRLAAKRGTRLPHGVALKIMAEVCDGLHAAHLLKDEHGESLAVVHRDVSPQNILVTSAGLAKVIDFGLVKAKGRSSAETQSGVVKGKIRYMAPEQLGGPRIDHRADVWAVGMCLYELLSGIVPYASEDDMDVLRRLTSSNPLPPFDLGLPAPLNHLLAQAIVKAPQGRFPNCGAMRRAIDATAKELGIHSETDDVADFLRRNLPELAQKRKETIAQATAIADALPVSMSGKVPAARVGPLATMDAFAATEVGRRGSDGGAASYGHTPSTTSLREQMGERPRRGAPLLLIAFVIAAALGAWLLWPRHDAVAPKPAASAPVETATAPPPPPPPTSPPIIELPTTTITSPLLPPPPRKPGAAPRPGTAAPPTPAATSDGGLSAGAQAAAAVMLVPPPTEAPPPAPPPTASALPPVEPPK